MVARLECRSLPSVARATFTIVVSRIDITLPSIATPETIQTWRGIRSRAAVGAVVAVRERMVPNHSVPSDWLRNDFPAGLVRTAAIVGADGLRVRSNGRVARRGRCLVPEQAAERCAECEGGALERGGRERKPDGVE